MADEDCPICLTVLQSKEDTVLLECCKKQLHITCYMKCIEQKTECPMCRGNKERLQIQSQEHSQSQNIQPHTTINIPQISRTNDIVLIRNRYIPQPTNYRGIIIPSILTSLFIAYIIINNKHNMN
jgi:hypothetical protein